jgi:hypothetical protein
MKEKKEYKQCQLFSGRDKPPLKLRLAKQGTPRPPKLSLTSVTLVKEVAKEEGTQGKNEI